MITGQIIGLMILIWGVALFAHVRKWPWAWWRLHSVISPPISVNFRYYVWKGLWYSPCPLLFPVLCHHNPSPLLSSHEWWTNYKLSRLAEKIENLQSRRACIFFSSFISSPGCGFIPAFHRVISLRRRIPVWQPWLMNEIGMRISFEGASKP